MSGAPFHDRLVTAPAAFRGLTYLGRPVRSRDSSLFLHLIERVLDEGQWRYGISEGEYLDDPRAAIRAPAARLVVYQRQGGAISATLGPNILPAERRGPDALPFIYVVYSADRGMLISDYQVSGLATVSIPGDARWLR